jgi:hypothetical protein
MQAARWGGGSSQGRGWDSNMSDRFTTALLAALNESTEFKDSGWNSIEEALRCGPRDPASRPPALKQATVDENRFAATICLGMGKGRPTF